jgi:hypothetical protein
MRKKMALVLSVTANYRHRLQADRPTAEGAYLHARVVPMRLPRLPLAMFLSRSRIILRQILRPFSEFKQPQGKIQREPHRKGSRRADDDHINAIAGNHAGAMPRSEQQVSLGKQPRIGLQTERFLMRSSMVWQYSVDVPSAERISTVRSIGTRKWGSGVLSEANWRLKGAYGLPSPQESNRPQAAARTEARFIRDGHRDGGLKIHPRQIPRLDCMVRTLDALPASESAFLGQMMGEVNTTELVAAEYALG